MKSKSNEYEADIINELIDTNKNLRNLNAEIRDLRIVIEDNKDNEKAMILLHNDLQDLIFAIKNLNIDFKHFKLE